MLNERRGEKIGWLGGWLGAFLWIGVLSIVWIVQGKLRYGIAGLGILVVAVVGCIGLAPWQHPDTRIWKLILPLYAIEIVAVWLCILAFGGWKATGLHWWNLSWLCLFITPLFTLGRRRWRER